MEPADRYLRFPGGSHSATARRGGTAGPLGVRAGPGMRKRPDGVSTQHRRNIVRASKAGLSLRRTREASACAKHLELMDASTERRASRGEKVDSGQDSARPLALLASGSGEIFQAVMGEQVLSSILVLRSSQGAYYQSAGTLPEGMRLGASPFLVSQVAALLKQEGARVFSLGGASAESPGLRRFKAGFGAREFELQAASFCPKSAAQRRLQARCDLVGPGRDSDPGPGCRTHLPDNVNQN